MTVVLRFTVAPGELLDPANDVHVHRGLVKGWRRWGTLVHDGALQRVLGSKWASRQEVQKLWLEAWKAASEGGLRLVTSAEDLSLGEEATPRDLGRLGTHVSLAVIKPPGPGTPQAAEAAQGRDRGCTCSPMREVEDCLPVRRAEANQEMDIPWNMPPRQVWQERFAELSRTARSITIVDRYALERHLSQLARSSLPAEGGESASGLWNAIQFIAEDVAPTRRKRVALVTTDEVVRGAPPAELREAAMLLVRRARDRRVDLTVFLHRSLHARWVRFDGAVCALDSGLEVLEPARKRKVYDYSVKSNPEAVASFRRNETAYEKEGRRLQSS